METKKRPAIKRIKYYFLYLLVKTILLMAYYSPRKLVLYFCGFLGGVSYYLVGDARKKTIRHLTMVYGREKSNEEIQTMAKQVFHMIGKNAGDVMRSVHMKELACFKKVVRNLKSEGVVAMLIDQDTKVKSVFVDFMGMPASTPVGAALFAIRTGAKVIPMGIYLDQDNQQQLKIFPEVQITTTGNEADDLFNNTLTLSKASEMLINQDPTQWVWMHERWKTKPQIAS
ncbi:lysophospholipid acyltransferase family protein [Cecembia lonarensis]|uniref:Lipid A biosynthesis lauroyl acyltransferase n=1 Tax=Cecembia lonarensis (strain CCUG 58316 / KCTC 22772 / LW9) TaxID=1225176 RepID=K1LC12_CECL9|nr:lysophospholipid acyltransferase family protein [Cecembia lonarensis]EKB47893.1 lipid A biosynthesis lauroyl acyltransferase [Cecembia lonarensis LW9]